MGGVASMPPCPLHRPNLVHGENSGVGVRGRTSCSVWPGVSVKCHGLRCLACALKRFLRTSWLFFGLSCVENVLVRTRKLRNGRRDAEISGDNMYLCRRNIEM